LSRAADHHEPQMGSAPAGPDRLWRHVASVMVQRGERDPEVRRQRVENACDSTPSERLANPFEAVSTDSFENAYSIS
jgi:hypothetical protein